MLMNQIVDYSDNSEVLTELFLDVLWPPSDDSEAFAKIERLAEFAETIKRGAHPAVGHIPFFLSCQWALAERGAWPVIWPSAARFAEFLTGQELPPPPAERYEALVDAVRHLDTDMERYEWVASWWDDQNPVLVDRVLAERFEFRLGFCNSTNGEWDSESIRPRKTNFKALESVGKHMGHTLSDEVAGLLGREVELHIAGAYQGGPDRWDIQVDWRVPELYAPGLRVWINHLGMSICLTPGYGPPDRYGGKGTEKRWYRRLIDTLSAWKQDGNEIFNVSGGRYGRDRDLCGRKGSFAYGKWYEKGQLEGLDLRSELRRVVPQLRPVLEKWMELHSGDPPLPHPPPPPQDLTKLAEELLVRLGDLERIVQLLGDKGQVILYGPPGTGKTFLAKRLAECLAPEGGQRAF
ncbi:MAG: AAA family ATPase, partial [Acidimicrobiia bacterium]|nr:AAA family ATPase [Acidimicrobiia bacterium]